MIADGKRGDVGSTARAYAAAYLEGDEPRADALTVNPWLGRESIEPYLAAARRYGAGIFCVVKTSNAGGDVQDVTLSDGRPMWQHVAELVAEWGADLVGEHGLSAVGAVVGATHPRAVSEARKLMPQAILLLPGVGAQGATPADLARAFTSGPASALVTASRSVIYASRESGGDFREAAGAEAARLQGRGHGPFRAGSERPGRERAGLSPRRRRARAARPGRVGAGRACLHPLTPRLNRHPSPTARAWLVENPVERPGARLPRRERAHADRVDNQADDGDRGARPGCAPSRW